MKTEELAIVDRRETLIDADAIEINQLHIEVVDAYRSTLNKAIRIGFLLDKKKCELEHGEYSKWITANLSFTDRTARNYRRVYLNRDRLKTETVSVLDAYRQLRPLQQSTDDIKLSLINEALSELELVMIGVDKLAALGDLSGALRICKAVSDLAGQAQNIAAEIRLRNVREAGKLLRPTSPLTPEEKDRLSELESVIERGMPVVDHIFALQELCA